jgi:hypothetical protein
MGEIESKGKNLREIIIHGEEGNKTQSLLTDKAHSATRKEKLSKCRNA